MGTVEFNYRELRLPAVKEMSGTLGEISGAQWEAPSLCEAWQVRHIPAHLVTGYLFSAEEVGAVVAQVGSVPEAARLGAIEFASAHDGPGLAEAFERHVAQPEVTGIVATFSPQELFVDQVVHRLDVAIPLGLPADIREEHLVAALAAMPEIDGFIQSRARASGLRLEATDVPWSWGSGPVVRGSGEAFMLAMSGRPCGLERCEGDGVEILASRQGVDGRSR